MMSRVATDSVWFIAGIYFESPGTRCQGSGRPWQGYAWQTNREAPIGNSGFVGGYL